LAIDPWQRLKPAKQGPNTLGIFRKKEIKTMDTAHPTPEQQAAPPSAQAMFQARTDAIAHHMAGLMIALDTPPVMAALACSQIIQAVLADLNKHNPNVASALMEEFANSLLVLASEHGISMNVNGEGETKQ
jgi:hypothetical protein